MKESIKSSFKRLNNIDVTNTYSRYSCSVSKHLCSIVDHVVRLSYLYSTESVEQVRIVADAGADASTFMLTRLDELGDLITVHAVKLAHEVHYS